MTRVEMIGLAPREPCALGKLLRRAATITHTIGVARTDAHPHLLLDMMTHGSAQGEGLRQGAKCLGLCAAAGMANPAVTTYRDAPAAW
jgi:hypothetical protein